MYSKDEEYNNLLKAFDRGYLCVKCSNKIYYGTYYDGKSELCEECCVYKDGLHEDE